MTERATGCACGKVFMDAATIAAKRWPVFDGWEHRYSLPCRIAPEKAGREGDQALPEEGEGDCIRELIARLEERHAIGLRRYGRPLQRFNGRNVFRDIADEGMDLAAYAIQADGEVKAVVAALLVLAGEAERHRNPSGRPFAPSVEAALELAAKLEGRG